MYTIKKAFIEIDIDEYLEKLVKYQGYIDAADSMREPNDTYKVDSFDSLKHAEREIDTDVVLTIDSDQATIEYYYIEGSDKVYFTHVLYENKRYPIDEDLYSKSCYRAILKNLDLDDQPKNLRESINSSLAERIIDNLKYGVKTKTSQNILNHIINALNGDKIHFFSGWHRRGGWNNLNVVPQAHDAYDLLLKSKIKVFKGNDAPRGGSTGSYWETELNRELAKELEKYII